MTPKGSDDVPEPSGTADTRRRFAEEQRLIKMKLKRRDLRLPFDLMRLKEIASLERSREFPAPFLSIMNMRTDELVRLLPLSGIGLSLDSHCDRSTAILPAPVDVPEDDSLIAEDPIELAFERIMDSEDGTDGAWMLSAVTDDFDPTFAVPPLPVGSRPLNLSELLSWLLVHHRHPHFSYFGMNEYGREGMIVKRGIHLTGMTLRLPIESDRYGVRVHEFEAYAKRATMRDPATGLYGWQILPLPSKRQSRPRIPLVSIVTPV